MALTIVLVRRDILEMDKYAQVHEISLLSIDITFKYIVNNALVTQLSEITCSFLQISMSAAMAAKFAM